MPRIPKTPAYRLHSATGQAVVSLPIGGGKYHDEYLGKHGTAESRQKYDRLIAEWLANGRLVMPKPGATLTVAELCAAYWGHVQQSLFRFDALTGLREPSTMQGRIQCSLRPVRKLYGAMPAASFGPLALKAVRKSMIDKGLSRTRINQLIDCVKGCFSWAVTEELIAEAVAAALDRVPPLARGRSTAPEPRKVKPAPIDRVDAVMLRVLPPVAAMIRFQLLTGARPGEAVIVRPIDIDRSKPDWVYRPAREKTDDLAAQDGIERELFIGPQAQQILAPFLDRLPEAFCFSPREAELARQWAAGQKGETTAKDRYTVASYGRAIREACDALWPPPEHLRRKKGSTNFVRAEKGRPKPVCVPAETKEEWMARLGAKGQAELKAWYRAHRWHPHQLRHSAATRVEDQFGYDVARQVLGHRTISATKIYVEQSRAKAAKAMREVG